MSVSGQFMHNRCLLPQLFFFHFLSSFLQGLVKNLFQIRNGFDIFRFLSFSKPQQLAGVGGTERAFFLSVIVDSVKISTDYCDLLEI